MFNRAKQFTEEKMGKAERTENDVVSSYNLKNCLVEKSNLKLSIFLFIGVLGL